MKKITLSLLAATVLFTGMNIQSTSASKNVGDSNLVEAETYSKVVTKTIGYTSLASSPTSISYNSNGYTGTLYKYSSAYTGEEWLVTYRGTVRCSSNCILSSDSKE